MDYVARVPRRRHAINLRMKVTCIEHRIHRAPNDEGKVVVTVEDGRSFPFDDVVITAPLGWLKRHQDVFKPPLEARLTKAIRGIGYGNLEKVRHFDTQIVLRQLLHEVPRLISSTPERFILNSRAPFGGSLVHMGMEVTGRKTLPIHLLQLVISISFLHATRLS